MRRIRTNSACTSALLVVQPPAAPPQATTRDGSAEPRRLAGVRGRLGDSHSGLLAEEATAGHARGARATVGRQRARPLAGAGSRTRRRGVRNAAALRRRSPRGRAPRRRRRSAAGIVVVAGVQRGSIGNANGGTNGSGLKGMPILGNPRAKRPMYTRRVRRGAASSNGANRRQRHDGPVDHPRGRGHGGGHAQVAPVALLQPDTLRQRLEAIVLNASRPGQERFSWHPLRVEGQQRQQPCASPRTAVGGLDPRLLRGRV